MSYITREISWEFRFSSNSLTGPPGFLSGWHRMNGLLVVMGPDVKAGTVIKNANIIDLAPTILYLTGIPVPSDMDGRVLKEIFKPESPLAENEVRYQSPEMYKRKKYVLTSDEEREIKRKLKALGYLD